MKASEAYAPYLDEVERMAHSRYSSLAARSKKLRIAPPELNDIIAVFLESFNQEGFHCCYCERPMVSYQEPPLDFIASLDHAFPLSRGGKNERSNYKVCCFGCNIAKKTKTEGVWRQYAKNRQLMPDAFDAMLHNICVEWFIQNETKHGRALPKYTKLKIENPGYAIFAEDCFNRCGGCGEHTGCKACGCVRCDCCDSGSRCECVSYELMLSDERKRELEIE